MGYYDADPAFYQSPNWTECATCGSEFDDYEREGNICPACLSKSYEKEGEE